MSENVGQGRLNFFSLEYFDALKNDDKIKDQNILEKKISLLCAIFSDMKMFIITQFCRGKTSI